MKLFERGKLDMSMKEGLIRSLMQSVPGATREQIEAIMEDEASQEIWLNDLYQVIKRPVEHIPGMFWLSIKRRDKESIHDWRDLQEIKNLLVGPECEGIELYPAESRRVDTANQYHLWVWSDPKVRFPVGFGDRAVSSDSSPYWKQRPL
jgi:hypothetical protein